MIVHRAIIFEPSKLREWARKDAWRYRNLRASRHHRPNRERDLAQLGDWLGIPVGYCVAEDASLNGSAGSEAADVAAPIPAAAPGRVAVPRMRPDPAEPTPADRRLGPSFPEQHLRERP
jgi:hypothetical protein